MTNRRIVQISKQEGVEKDDESGNDSVLNISLHDDDVPLFGSRCVNL